jgi:hypothetical protein
MRGRLVDDAVHVDAGRMSGDDNLYHVHVVMSLYSGMSTCIRVNSWLPFPAPLKALKVGRKNTLTGSSLLSSMIGLNTTPATRTDNLFRSIVTPSKPLTTPHWPSAGIDLGTA